MIGVGQSEESMEVFNNRTFKVVTLVFLCLLLQGHHNEVVTIDLQVLFGDHVPTVLKGLL